MSESESKKQSKKFFKNELKLNETKVQAQWTIDNG
jgi:hypothetical protein